MYIIFGIFWSVPDEHYRFWPFPDARICVNLDLFIGIIHDSCSHMTPLVYLKKINTTNPIYNCNYALKHKNVRTVLATHFIRYNSRKHQPVTLTKISNISRGNSLRIHNKECLIICVNIS